MLKEIKEHSAQEELWDLAFEAANKYARETISEKMNPLTPKEWSICYLSYFRHYLRSNITIVDDQWYDKPSSK